MKKLSEYYSLDIEIEQGEIKLDNYYCLDGNMYGDFHKEQTNVKEDYYKVTPCLIFPGAGFQYWSTPSDQNICRGYPRSNEGRNFCWNI